MQAPVLTRQNSLCNEVTHAFQVSVFILIIDDQPVLFQYVNEEVSESNGR